MPLFTTSIQNQEQGSTSGSATYPQLSQLKKGAKVSDEFIRDTLNPTDSYPVYTTAVTGTSTVGMVANRDARILTGVLAAENGSLVATGMGIQRRATMPTITDPRSAYTVRICFSVTTAASSEIFVGLQTSSSLTAFLTTTQHVGIKLDASVSGNYFFTSANGSAQVTADTGITAANGDSLCLEIIVTGDNSVTMNLYRTTSGEVVFSTVLATTAVTAWGGDFDTQFISMWGATETTAARDFRMLEWNVQAF